MELPDEERRRRRVGELCEGDRELLGAKSFEQRPDHWNDLTRLRHFHRLSRIDEAALHVDDQERGAAALQPKHARERLTAAGHRTTSASAMVESRPRRLGI